MSSGKKLRLQRFYYPDQSFGMIVPIDHGLTIGPVKGLERASGIAGWVKNPAITGIVVHKGMAERLAEHGVPQQQGLMVHLNGMSSRATRADDKVFLTRLETAMALGADAISLQLNFDGSNDSANLPLLGQIVDESMRYGLPVLTMLYDKVTTDDTEKRVERLRHLIRITIELGTDAIKLAAPTSLDEIPMILDGLCEDAAIFFAGGSLCSDEVLKDLARATLRYGGRGLCIGRNVFQRETPAVILRDLRTAMIAESREIGFVRDERVEHGVH